jgi:hypothetical protein
LEQIKDINPEKMRWFSEIRKIPEIQRCDKLMEDASMLIAERRYEKAIARYKDTMQKSVSMLWDVMGKITFQARINWILNRKVIT